MDNLHHGSNTTATTITTTSASTQRKCGQCKVWKACDAFPPCRPGARPTATCSVCSVRKKAARAAAKGTGKENVSPPKGNVSNIGNELEDMSLLALEDFLSILKDRGNIFSIEASVDLSAVKCLAGRREKADKVVELVWEMLDYRFIYHSKYDMKRGIDETTRFAYNCAQSEARQHNPRKVADASKHRDKESMACFACNGWVYLTISDSSETAFIKIQHGLDHVPYWTIDIPTEVDEFICKNTNLTVTQLWTEILKRYPKPKFSRKSVYHRWAVLDRKQWKRDEDEVKSARMILEEASKGVKRPDGTTYSVKLLGSREETGFSSISFALTEPVQQWSGRIRELSMDSAWNTNASAFELYALLGETYGKGLPLAFNLTRSGKSGDKGAKERILTQFLAETRDFGKLKAKFTLSDKDWSEIHAFRNVFPDAKHQLCLWHCARAVKKRLSILRRTPGPYDVEAAIKEFPWIDRSFVPIAQQNEQTGTPSTIEMAAQALPQIRVRLNGELLPVPVPKRLIIRLRPLASVLRDRTNSEPLPANEATQAAHSAAGPGDEVFENDAPTIGSSKEDISSDSDASSVVDKLFNKSDGEEEDQEDAPDWEFEPHETRSQDSTYVFCPAPHRRQLCHIFVKHFCQHPLLPGREGTRTAQQIRDEAVYEMYKFCHQRGLADTWAYMWNSWYQLSRWKLWARSTEPDFISRLRTTMNAENFWKQLKHGPLHNLLRPRLDQLTWILVHVVLPEYLLRAEMIEDGHGLGRPSALTPYQQYFKRDWKQLEQQTVSGKDYKTNVKQWTCQCGYQMFNCHHLCKHLVQKVGKPPVDFWRKVIRRRTQPLYCHAIIQGPKEAIDDDELGGGSITDGDDHDWHGDESALQDGEKWRKLLTGPSNRLLGKRQREVIELELDSLPPSDDIDASSSAIEGYSSDRFGVGDGDSDGDEDLVCALKSVSLQVKTLRKAADILEHQLQNDPSPIWVRSMANHNVAREAEKLVKSVQLRETSGRKRDRTWAKGKDERERATFLMGYQPRSLR